MDNLIEYNTSAFFVVDKTKPICVNNAGHYIINERNYTTNRPNGREDYQIIYVYRGEMSVIRGSKKQIVKAGNIIFYKPFETQTYTYLHHNESEIYWVHFYGTSIERILKDLSLDNLEQLYIGEDLSIPRYINSIMSNLIIHEYGFEYYCQGNLLKILAIIGRHKNEISIKQNANKERFDKVLHAMSNSNNNKMGIKEYADMCYMSISRFSHVFKETFNESPITYLTNRKIERAKALLIESDFLIKEIANSLGYDDAYYFSRIFKKYVGKSPEDYRKDLKKRAIEDASSEYVLSHIKIESGKAILDDNKNEWRLFL